MGNPAILMEMLWEITISMGKSPFSWGNQHFHGKISIFVGKSATNYR
jgi:hypothetical protein